MNFSRGHQMIVHDPGLGVRADPTRQLVPPVAYRRWTVHPHNTVNHILSRVGNVGGHCPGGLDAVHFMAHGSPGSMRIGRERMNNSNIDSFAMLEGNVRFIVFFSCSVGGERQGASYMRGEQDTYGRRISDISGATVVMAQQTQTYSYSAEGVIDFGPWEGPVDVFSPGRRATYQADNPFRQERRIDLESMIFGGR